MSEQLLGVTRETYDVNRRIT